MQNINSNKLRMPITFYQIQKENKIMRILVTLHLKMVAEVEDVVLEILTFLALFQLSLKIFLAKVLVVEDGQEELIIEDLI